MNTFLPPLVARADRATLIEAARAEGLPIDLSGAVLDDGGWENIVLATADGWILRFPRSEDVPFDREMALLRRLSGRLTVPIPQVVWIGKRVRMAVYRKLTGASFSADAYAQAPSEVRDRLARSLVDFLVAMHHSLTSAECRELGITRVDHRRMLDFVFSHIRQVPAERQPEVLKLAEHYADVWVHSPVTEPEVLLHNDFHTGNLVLTGPVGQLSGIWDFSCVQIGVPTYDLRYFNAGPHDLLHRVADHYTEATGIAIDVPAAIVAHRMETICDALESGRLALLESALADRR